MSAYKTPDEFKICCTELRCKASPKHFYNRMIKEFLVE